MINSYNKTNTQKCYMSYMLLSANLYDIYHCCKQWKTPDDWQRNCPKHVEFHSKNKSEKLVHLVGFIIRNSWACSYKISPPIWKVTVHNHTPKIPKNWLYPYCADSSTCIPRLFQVQRFVDSISKYSHLPPVFKQKQYALFSAYFFFRAVRLVDHMFMNYYPNNI